MAKKKKKPQSEQTPEKKEDKKTEFSMSRDPWIAMGSGLRIIGLVSIGLFIYMVWQLYPTEGWGNALLWGLSFAIGIWVIFGLSLAFNTWLRRRIRGGK